VRGKERGARIGKRCEERKEVRGKKSRVMVGSVTRGLKRSLTHVRNYQYMSLCLSPYANNHLSPSRA
jgi:hypothetical protein